MALSPDPQDDYVSDIASIRAEIRALQTRKRFLSSSLLSSDTLQRQLAPGSAAATRQITDASPLLQTASAHAQTNQHRVAFSTTTFPFSDPAPQNRNNGEGGKLLGVRIDVCARNGQFVRPYYVLLKKVGGQNETAKRVVVHRHTIPAFIPMQRLERAYLPSSSSAEDQAGEGNLKPWKTKPQNLPGFIRVLRRNLTSWHLRRDAIIHLREKLGARLPEERTHPEDHTGVGAGEKDWPLPVNDMGLVSLGPTSLEARYIRLEWDDGRVGRFKVSDRGRVERAVVIGDRGRDKALEGILTGGDGRIEGVIRRLNGS